MHRAGRGTARGQQRRRSQRPTQSQFSEFSTIMAAHSRVSQTECIPISSSSKRPLFSRAPTLTPPCPPPPPCARVLPLTLFFSVSPCLRGEYSFACRALLRVLSHLSALQFFLCLLSFSASRRLRGEHPFDLPVSP